VGLPPALGGRIVSFDEGLELAEGLSLLSVDGSSPLAPPGFRPPANRASYARKAGRLGRDDFSHEAFLSIEEDGALYLFTGCSHSGITRMMEEARRRAGGLPIAAVVGGMHLFHSPFRPLAFRSDMRRLGADLARSAGTRYYTGHCSVEDGLSRLRPALGGRLTRFRSGSVFEL
jgi:7,8-dihydropterin-6-yl-methyl-4-(beta-D-ribofuranosyl)aminobenzene 5'-phosphate synthase